MNRKLSNYLNLLAVFLILPLFQSCSLSEYFRKAVLGHTPILRAFVQKEFKTYTSITDIKDEMKLVTAKQQLDFINIMDGKDGRYLEISTYEVKAGIDCGKMKSATDSEGNVSVELPEIEIFSSVKIHSVAARTEADNSNSNFYEECIKPVNIAYEQKAKDYSVELGLLDKARDKAKDTLQNLTGNEFELNTGKYKQTIDISYVPFKIEISENYLKDNKIEIQEQPKDQFNRDALILKNSGNDGWSIRFGDSGRRFTGKFNEFYENVFETNTNKSNLSKDRVEIFRYFDPMYPKESEILSYASDNFRTFFLLNNGRIYYLDAVFPDEQTLLSQVSPSMVYLASSLRKIDERVNLADEYKNYIDKYFDVQESLRTNSDRHTLDVNTGRLISSNVLRTNDSVMTSEEKYIKAVSDSKNLGRTKDDNKIALTDDDEFNEITTLISELVISPDSFKTSEIREKALNTASVLNTKIKKEDYIDLALTQYLKTWFLQNANKLALADSEKNMYLSELKSSPIASRVLISEMGDSERNEYYFELFKRRLSMSHKYVDTAGNIDNLLKKSQRADNLFVYFNLPETNDVISDGEIYDQMKKFNNGREIRNSFILVFNQKEFDFGMGVGNFKKDFSDNDYHAIVLDDATLRLFLNVGSQSILEKGIDVAQNLAKTWIKFNYGDYVEMLKKVPGLSDVIDSALSTDKTPRFFFLGDWKNLRVTPENVTINGHSFATRKLTSSGKSEYRNTNDYAEKSVIADVIDDLQHAYSSNDADYYYNTLCNNLQNQIQHYVYEKMFRPSPRMILDMTKDNKYRYNY